MVVILFGEGQGSTGIASDPLTQGVVPAFLMIDQSCAFRDRMMLLRRHNQGIDIKLIGEHGTAPTAFRYRLPPLLSSGFRTISNQLKNLYFVGEQIQNGSNPLDCPLIVRGEVKPTHP